MGNMLAHVGQAAYSLGASTLPQVGTGGAQNCAQSFHGKKRSLRRCKILNSSANVRRKILNYCPRAAIFYRT